MNAGAWGGEIGSRVQWVRGITAAGSECVLRRQDLAFAYRECEALEDVVAVEVGLTLERRAPEVIREQRAVFSEKRRWQRGLRCAGSVFRNPPGEVAGRLIEQAGLKGLQLGGARVAREHANFIIADEGACASDVRALMEIVRLEIVDRFGIELKPEIEWLS